jgi:hypothetical protein
MSTAPGATGEETLSLSIKLGDAGHARRHKLLATLVLSFALTADSIMCGPPACAQNYSSRRANVARSSFLGEHCRFDSAGILMQSTTSSANQPSLNTGLPAQPPSVTTNSEPGTGGPSATLLNSHILFHFLDRRRT